MLNILIREKNKKQMDEQYKTSYKHFPSSVREWNNSIYKYNKNSLNLIPVSTIISMKIIKSFFNLYNKDLEKKIRTKRLLLRLKRLSSNKIYLSNGEFKHSNNNVLINIYVFNRQKNNYLYKLKNKYLNKLFAKKNIGDSFIKLLRSIQADSLSYIKNVNNNKYLFMKALNIVETNENFEINHFKNLSNYVTIFYKKLLNLSMKRFRLYFLYKQLIYINKCKLSYNYIRLLKKHLENLYNKNVEFNLVNLRRFYLNSDIFSETIKLKLTRNKSKLRKIFNRLKDKIKTHEIFEKKSSKDKFIETKFVFDSLKYRHITGFRLEARGRLSKRYTASRSVSKLKYKGSLLNVDSSYNGLSSVLLKGNLRPNIQYTKLKSKTRIGSFGLKGWISGN